MAGLKELCTLEGHTDRVWCVAWNTSGTSLASCGGDQTVRIWAQEGEKWRCKTILKDSHERTIRHVAWSQCGNLLATASFDGTIGVWDKRTGVFECNATLEGHENEVKCAMWCTTDSGRFLATCSRDKTVWIWDVTDEDDYECASVLHTHTQDVKKVLWHPHYPILISCSYDNTIKFYREDDDDWTCFNTLEGHTSTVWAISLDPTGSRLASCSADMTVRIWQDLAPEKRDGICTNTVWNSSKCICTLTGYHDRTIFDVNWCKLTGMIATAGGDDKICVFRKSEDSSDNYDIICSQPMAHNEDLNSVQWNPKIPGVLASASDDCQVKLWELIE